MTAKKKPKVGGKSPPNIRKTKKRIIPDDVVNEKKPEQLFMFGEADMILNALETEKTEWKNKLEKIGKAHMTLEGKRVEAVERITKLADAIEAARKHAPMKDEPIPPMEKEVKEAARKEIEQTDLTDDEVGKMVDKTMEKTQEDEVKTTEKIEAAKAKKKKESKVGDTRTPPKPHEDKPLGKVETEPTAPEFKAYDLGILVPDLIETGDTVQTNYGDKTLVVEFIAGPLREIQMPGTLDRKKCPIYYNIRASEIDAPRDKEGRLPKDYIFSYLNNLIVKDGKLTNIFEGNDLEVTVIAKKIKKNPSTDPY